MPKCKNCGYQFKWMEITKKTIGIKQFISGITCPNCQAPHYSQLRKSRYIPFFILFHIYLMFFIFYSEKFTAALFIGGSVVFLLLLFFLFPYMITLKYGKQPDLY